MTVDTNEKRWQERARASEISLKFHKIESQVVPTPKHHHIHYTINPKISLLLKILPKSTCPSSLILQKGASSVETKMSTKAKVQNLRAGKLTAIFLKSSLMEFELDTLYWA